MTKILINKTDRTDDFETEQEIFLKMGSFKKVKADNEYIDIKDVRVNETGDFYILSNGNDEDSERIYFNDVELFELSDQVDLMRKEIEISVKNYYKNEIGVSINDYYENRNPNAALNDISKHIYLFLLQNGLKFADLDRIIIHTLKNPPIRYENGLFF